MTMTTKRARIFARTLGVLAAVAVAAGAPLAAGAAEAHGGGGGGGGAHFSGGGGGAHFGGGHAAVGGHAGFAGGARPAYAGGAHYAGAAGVRYGGAATAHAHYAVSANRSYGGYAAGGGRLVPGGGYAGARAGFGHPGFVGGSGRFWGGGYWGGRFWPGTHYGPGFAWFLPVLPFGYATYYWGGTPYYYYDNAYYNWDPSQNGYVATDPPPVMQGGSDEAPQSDVPPASDAPSPDYQPAPQSNYAQPPPQSYAPPPSSNSAASAGPRGNWSSAADIYVYPRNGQSEQQTSNDRFECHKWSVAQTGFDPTRSMNLQGNSADYRRAMGACLDARGYSVK